MALMQRIRLFSQLSDKARANIKLYGLLTFFLLLMFSAMAISPAIYEYSLLRDLADRIARDYASFSQEQVEESIEIEFERFRLDIPVDVMQVYPVANKGYSVVIDYQIPLHLGYGEYVISIDSFKHFRFHYQVDP
ncbi:MAG: hypothetical protein HQL54_00605 [Magnetococcales bacterium]|nr:hypothetical protein [Magnetococcales bacterium]